MIALILFAPAGAPSPRVGDTYEIERVRETVEKGSDASSASAFDRDTVLERVIAIRPDGMEIEYDLPSSPKDKLARSRNWEFPARVLKLADGSLQLLNSADLERRRDRWLKRAKLPKTACGRWIFSWNAFRIECDPQSVVKTISGFEPWPPDLRVGAPYRDPGAARSVPLVAQGDGFSADAAIDPDIVRREQAEADVVVAELLSGNAPTPAQAQRTPGRSPPGSDRINGVIRVHFVGAADAPLRRMTRVSTLDMTASDVTKTRTVTETVTRRRLVAKP